MSLALETEYDNRARVAGSASIVEAWARDAAAFRALNPPQVIPYGPSERQAIDLFAAPAHDGARVVVFIHGGYWRSLDKSFCSHFAGGLLQQGLTVAVPGYDLCPGVSLAEIVEQMRAACRVLARFGDRLVVAGHSAGGHLAACMLATDWHAVDSALHEPIVSAAYAISGLFDLTPLLHTSINEALRLDAAEAVRLSPIHWRPPSGLTLDAVVGGDESAEFQRQSRIITQAWSKAGVATRCEPHAGANHFKILDPLTDPGSPMTRRIAEMARA